jgi:hypothetical protein
MWTPVVNRFYLLSLPGVLLAILLGRLVNRRMNPRQFVLYVHSGLIVIGAILLIQAF